MSDTQQGADWWQASDGRWYPPEQHRDNEPAQGSQAAEPHEGFVRPGGDTYFPDPSGRYGLRAVKSGHWTGWVLKDRDSKKVESDPKGERLLADTPAPHFEDLATRHLRAADRADDLRLAPGSTQWQYRIVSATFGGDLEQVLNRYGMAGWEVLSVSAANGTLTITGNKIFALLKRPMSVEHPAR